MYVFGYGAPTGFRLALAHPERVTAIISQNGNAYVEGLSPVWEPWQIYWRSPTLENRLACRGSLTATTIRDFQYHHGTDPERVSRDVYPLDIAYRAPPGAEEIQLNLILDSQTKVSLYPAFQEYFRTHQPPMLAIWGKNDPFFLPAGAEAYRRDIPDAEVGFLNTGHFALETHAAETAVAIRSFLERRYLSPANKAAQIT